MNNKNLPLYVGLAIPVFMVAAIALVVYIPQRSVDPQYDFIYSTGGDPYSGPYIAVEDGKLVKKDPPEPDSAFPRPATPPAYELELFYYDVSEDEAREIILEQAQEFTADAGPLSPDGYEVSYGRRVEGVFPLFFGASTDYNSIYFYSENASKKLNIRIAEDRYRGSSFRFIGWVIE